MQSSPSPPSHQTHKAAGRMKRLQQHLGVSDEALADSNSEAAVLTQVTVAGRSSGGGGAAAPASQHKQHHHPHQPLTNPSSAAGPSVLSSLSTAGPSSISAEAYGVVNEDGIVERVIAPDGSPDTVGYVAAAVEEAAKALKAGAGPVQRTPLTKSSFLSKACGTNVMLKFENQQKTGSYKVRGALYAMSRLDPAARARGVVTVSAGNHAQAVAFAASSFKAKSTIFMPRFTPVAKVNATKSYGGNVILEGVTLDDCLAGAAEVSRKDGAPFVHPYDNFDVISGAGTVGVEILESVPDVSTVIVPIGGGGLICGIASYLKTKNPRIKVYGVEAAGAASMATALRTGVRAPLKSVNTICDGIAVKTPGKITTNIASQILDGVVTVSDVEVSRAMFYMLERSKSVNEPSSCVGVAALLYDKIPVTGSQKVVCVLTGGNVDMSFLTRVITHQSYSLSREVALRGLIDDKPGTLNSVLAVFAEAGMGIVSITHTRGAPEIKPGDAYLDLNVTVPNAEALKQALARVDSATGIPFKLRKNKAPQQQGPAAAAAVNFA